MTWSDFFLSESDLHRRPSDRSRKNAARPSLADDAAPHRIGVLLVPGFALMTYSCAVEPYRAANTLSGHELYRWLHISPDGGPVVASNGVAIVPDQGIDRPVDVDDLFVCAGGNPTLFDHGPTLKWLRAQARRGTRIGGVAGGPVILGRAGLLAGYRCTMHWEYIPAFKEMFQRHHVTTARYEIDGMRCTSSGGAAAMEMMTALIGRRYDRTLASAVSEWFLHSRLTAAGEPQRMSLRDRYGVRHAPLLSVLEHIEASIEEPVDRRSLAETAGVSVRQLERLFRAHLGHTIGEHVLTLRLDRARMLLRQTSMSVLDIAVATGFASAAHFSRSFRQRFGHAPRMERKHI